MWASFWSWLRLWLTSVSYIIIILTQWYDSQYTARVRADACVATCMIAIVVYCGELGRAPWWCKHNACLHRTGWEVHSLYGNGKLVVVYTSCLWDMTPYKCLWSGWLGLTMCCSADSRPLQCSEFLSNSGGALYMPPCTHWSPSLKTYSEHADDAIPIYICYRAFANNNYDYTGIKGQ